MSSRVFYQFVSERNVLLIGLMMVAAGWSAGHPWLGAALAVASCCMAFWLIYLAYYLRAATKVCRRGIIPDLFIVNGLYAWVIRCYVRSRLPSHIIFISMPGGYQFANRCQS